MRIRLYAFLLICLGWLGGVPVRGQAVTTVTINSLPNGSVPAGTVVMLTASVHDASGAVLSGEVTFLDGTTAVGKVPVVSNATANYVPGTATLKKIFGAGGHTIRAVYGGTASEQGSTSSTGTLTVTAGSATPSAGLVYGTTSPFGQLTRLESVLLVDINNDGLLDLVAPQFGFSNVAIALGDPVSHGIFQPPTFVSVPSPSINYCAVGDLNGDGLPDLVTSGANGDSAYVILQDAAHPGSFLSPKYVGSSVAKPLIADMNHDGIPDLVLYQAGNTFVTPGVTILLGDPQNPGSFLPATTTMISGSDIRSAAVADMNGDGLPDVVVGNYNAQTVSVLLNDPAHPGSLLAKVDYPAGGPMFDLAIGDMNGDGLPDVVMGSVYAGVTVVLNDRTNPGGLLAPHSYPVSATPAGGRSLGIAVGDIDGDGVLDVMSGNYGPVFDVLLGRGDGSLLAPTAYPTGPTPDTFEATAMAVGDIDGDGLTDVAVGQFYQNSAQIFLHQPDSLTWLITATDMSLSGSVVRQGGSLTITIKVSSFISPPPGSVTLYDSGSSGTYTAIATLPLDTTGTAVYTTNNLTLGFHSFQAVYSGSPAYAPSNSLIETVVVIATPTAALTLTGTPNPATVGQNVTFTATVSVTGNGTAPTGVVAFLDSGGSALALVPLSAGGVAVFQTSSLIVGTHTIQASYGGDSNYASQAVTINEVIRYPAATLSLSSSQDPVVAGQTVQFTAAVSATGPAPTGTVVFLDGGRQIGQIAVSANGTAGLSTSSFAVGTHAIQAVYSGDSNYDSQSATLSQIVLPAPTVTALLVSPNPAYPGVAVTLKAVVTGVGIPSGIVTFDDGALLIGTGTLDASGTAVLTVTTLQLGTHPLTAIFAGSSSAKASASPVVSEMIIPNPRDFALTSDSPLTLRTEHHGAATVTVTPVGGLSDVVSINCGAMPIYATCAVVPGQVSVGNGTAQSVSVQIETDQVAGYASLQRRLSVVAACLFPCFLLYRGRLRGLVLVLLLGVAAGGVIGCSGKYPLATPPGTYSIVIAGHGQTTGLDRTTTLSLVVTP
jgi:Bacterial Ig-like domain (group 3)/FG-GAP-like repeat/FG-GAP repeat